MAQARHNALTCSLGAMLRLLGPQRALLSTLESGLALVVSVATLEFPAEHARLDVRGCSTVTAKNAPASSMPAHCWYSVCRQSGSLSAPASLDQATVGESRDELSQ
jgi:hypothetical protein